MSRLGPVLKWSSVTDEEDNAWKQGVPKTRHKHAVCLHRGIIYLYGGKDSNNLTYKELWKYDIALTTWEKLKDTGEKPPVLQGHTMLGYKENLYIFGGNFCFAGSEETPLWIYNIQTSQWKKYNGKSETKPINPLLVTTCLCVDSTFREINICKNFSFYPTNMALSPSSRRSHTMVHYAGNLYVYGGYIDLKGSTSQLWVFDIDKKTWQLLYSIPQQSEGPGIRHSHSSVVYDKAMWVFGGMADLQVKTDMWRWHFGVKHWQKVKLRQSVPELVDHTAVQVNGHMLVYGGVKEGAPHSDTWSFHFESLTWQKLQPSTSIPPPRSQHGVILVNPLQLGFSTAVSENSRTSSAPYVREAQLDMINTMARPSSSPAYSKDERSSRRMVSSNKILPKDLPVVTKDSLNGKKEKQEKEAIAMQVIDVNHHQNNTHHHEMKETALITYADCTQFTNASSNNHTKVKSTGYAKFLQAQRLRNQQCTMRRQSSSCDSVNQGSTPCDSKSLLQQQRSKTFGNISLDSESGMDNLAYLDSSGNSDYLRSMLSGDSTWSDLSANSRNNECDDVDLKNQEPVKKLRKYHSQFSDDFMLSNKYGSANKVIQKRNRQAVWKKCASVENMLRDKSFANLNREGQHLTYLKKKSNSRSSDAMDHKSDDSLMTAANGDYNVNLSGSDIPRRKSVVSDDLYLVDIEDWELEEVTNKESGTLVNNSPTFRNKPVTGMDKMDSCEEKSLYSYDDLSVNSHSVLLGNDVCNVSDYKYSGEIGIERKPQIKTLTFENMSFDAFSTALASSHSSIVNKIKPAWQKIDEDIEMTELDLETQRNDEALTRCDYFTYGQQKNEPTVQNDVKNVFSNHTMKKGYSIYEKKKNSKSTDKVPLCDTTNDDTQFSMKKPDSYKDDDDNGNWDRTGTLLNKFQPTHYVMMILGGKEARSKNFSAKPLSMWRLEIKF